MRKTLLSPATITSRCRRCLGLSLLLSCLSAGWVESATVTLAWDPPAGSIAGYLISYGTTSGEYTSSIDVGGATTFQFVEPDPTKIYYLAVRAYNTTGLPSPYSNEVATTPDVLPLPPPLSVTNLAANLPSPQPVGATITFTATATGGAAPYQYKWWIFDGTTSTVGKSWSTGNSFAWTPTTPNPNYSVTVWARNASSTADTFDNPAAKLSLTFAISPALVPTVASVSPSSGPASGGTSVTITGTNFVSGATLTFGGAAATSVIVVSATSITARTPAHAAGPVNVVVTTTQSGVLSNGFSYTSSTPSSISLVQRSGKNAGTTRSSTLAFTAANTAGNWIGVAIRAGRTGQTLTVSDTRGNTYRRAVQLNDTAGATTVALFYAENIAGGANTVTVSNTSRRSTLLFTILEYAGVATLNSLDGAAASQGYGTTPNSGPATATANGDLIVGVISSGVPVTFVAGSGYAIRNRVPAAPNTRLIVEDRLQATAGPVSATATTSTATNWGAILAAFRASGGGVMQMVTFK
jgi:hypothetical protein